MASMDKRECCSVLAELVCPMLRHFDILFPSLAWSTLVVSVQGTEWQVFLLRENGGVEVTLRLY